MTLIRIDDATDPRLANYAGVREPSLLVDRGLFMAEGRFVVRRLLGSGRYRIQSLLLNDAAAQALVNDFDHADPDIPVYVATPDVIRDATGFNMHRGCLALVERPAELSLESALAGSRMLVVLERVVDADNVGSIFRNAEAFDVDAVLLSPGCCDPLYRKALRTSSGAALTVPSTRLTPWPDALDRVRAAGFTIAALTPDRQATDLDEFVSAEGARGAVALLFGNEGHGLTAEALAYADVQLRIPTAHTLDSLNIATASGIALHRFRSAREQR